VGNLNQFYLMGRVANSPSPGTTPDGRPLVELSIMPGTGSRSPRGPVEPLILEAHGPQVDVAKGLNVGQCVLLRGQLRQEPRGGTAEEPGPARLVARVQAIELLAEGARRPPRDRDGDSDADGPTRRRRRRRGRGRREGAADRGAEGQAAPAAGTEPASTEGGPAEAPPPAPAKPLPPPKPIAPQVEPSEPLPDSKSDMPF
jgi:hypothetical protein